MASVIRAPFYVPRPDDSPDWYAAPICSNTITLLTVQQEYGVGGQVWTKNWLPNYTLDDSSVWSGAPSVADPIPLLTFQRVYGKGGQVPTKQWHYDFDDASSWQFQAPHNASVSVAPSPFSTRWNYHFDDATVWNASPAPTNSIRATLTQLRMYGQSGQVPTKVWHYDNDDYSSWSWQANYNAAAKQAAAPLVVRWGNYYDDASLWSGSPLASEAISLLTFQRLYGAGGQVPTKQWHYDLDDASSWQWLVPHNQSLTQVNAPFVVRWRYETDDAAVWTGKPAGDQLLFPLLTAAGIVKSKRWLFGYDDASYWTGTPISISLIDRLTSTRIYGAGGQGPTKQWHYDTDDASTWLAAPVAYPAVFVSIVKFYGAAGQAPTKDWASSYMQDDAAVWYAAPILSKGIVLTTTQQKVYGQPGQVPTKQWRYDFDDASVWQFQYHAPPVVPGSVSPFHPVWPLTSDDTASWQWPSKSINVRFMVTPRVRKNLDYGQPGPEFWTFPWREIVQNNLPNLSTLPPVSKMWNLNIPQDTPSIMTGRHSAQFYIPLLLLIRIANAIQESRTENADPQVEIAVAPVEVRDADAAAEERIADAPAETRTGEIPSGDI